MGAGAVGGVEGKQPGGELLHDGAVLRAGKVLRKHQLPGGTVVPAGFRRLGQAVRQGDHRGRAGPRPGLRQNIDDGDALRSLQAGGQGIRQPFLQVILFHQPVHHHLNVVAVVFVQLNVVGELTDLPIHPHPHKPLRRQAGEQLFMGALLTPDHRRQHLEAGAIGQGHDPVDHLIDGLGGDAAIAVGAVGLPGPAVEQPQVVVDLRHRAHGGAGVVGGGFLINGDGGTEALNGVHIGLIHLTQELAGVGTEGLHVAPLALGENRVKGQGGLAGPRHPGEDNQLITGNLQVQVLQVMLPGPANADDVIVQGTVVMG